MDEPRRLPTVKVANALVHVPAGDLAGYRARLSERGIYEFGGPARPTVETTIFRIMGGDATTDELAVELVESDEHRAAWRIEEALPPSCEIVAAPVIREVR